MCLFRTWLEEEEKAWEVSQDAGDSAGGGGCGWGSGGSSGIWWGMGI